MTDDLIARLIVGPGSRELDAEIVMFCYPDIGAPAPHCAGDEPIFWHEPYRKKPVPKLTTSLDAAVAFAVAVLGAERARYLVSRTVYIQWDEDEDGQTALDALPRHIVAEILKARGDD